MQRLPQAVPVLSRAIDYFTGQTSIIDDSADEHFAAIKHVVDVTTRKSLFWWTLSACLSAVVIVFNELHSWQTLSERNIIGCTLNNSTNITEAASDLIAAVSSGNTTGQSGLAACAALGLFDCQSSLSTTTWPVGGWSNSLFLYLLLVGSFWFGIMWILSNQIHRAAMLLPHKVIIKVRAHNIALLVLTVLITAGYCGLKFSVFTTMPNETVLGTCGPQPGGLKLILAPPFSESTLVFDAPGIPSATAAETTRVLGIDPTSLWALANSTLVLLLSFQGVFWMAWSYASDCYADISFLSLVHCPRVPLKPSSTSAREELDTPLLPTSKPTCPAHSHPQAGAAGTSQARPHGRLVCHSTVTAALHADGWVTLDSRHLDKAMQAWYEQEGKKCTAPAWYCCRRERPLRWSQARYLVNCGPDIVRSAASFVHSWAVDRPCHTPHSPTSQQAEKE